MSLVTFGPMLLFFRTGVWMTPLGTQFPFADRSDIAFYMDLAIQMIVGILGIMISVSIEMSQVIINNVVVMGADVMTLNMKELAEQLTSNNAMSIKVRAKFRNIMIQAEDFDGYVIYTDERILSKFNIIFVMIYFQIYVMFHTNFLLANISWPILACAGNSILHFHTIYTRFSFWIWNCGNEVLFV